jgi:hypothetical protein
LNSYPREDRAPFHCQDQLFFIIRIVDIHKLALSTKAKFFLMSKKEVYTKSLCCKDLKESSNIIWTSLLERLLTTSFYDLECSTGTTQLWVRHGNMVTNKIMCNYAIIIIIIILSCIVSILHQWLKINVEDTQPSFSISRRNYNQSPLYRVMLFGYLYSHKYFEEQTVMTIECVTWLHSTGKK